MKSLEEMMKADGWELKYYENSGKQYWAFHKDGFQIDYEDIAVHDDTREWKEEGK